MIARITEPASKADFLRVLTDLGADAMSYRTIQRHLVKVNTGGYREAIAAKSKTITQPNSRTTSDPREKSRFGDRSCHIAQLPELDERRNR